jgi:hypothetical protein
MSEKTNRTFRHFPGGCKSTRKRHFRRAFYGRIFLQLLRAQLLLLIIAQSLDIFKTGASCEDVVGDIQNMIRFPVRHVTLQQNTVRLDF